MLSCLENNYIGIKQLPEYNSPVSGIFINELDGISTSQLESLQDPEEDYEDNDVWVKIYNRSLNLFYQDIKSNMVRYFKKFSLINNGNTAVLRKLEPITQENWYSGYYFNVYNYSPNLSIQLNNIDIHLESPSTFDVIIADAATGETLKIITHTGQTGQNIVNINLTYPIHLYQKLFIGINKSEVDAVKYTYYAFAPYAWPYVRKFQENDPPYYENFQGDEAFFSLKYNVVCDIDNFVCQRIRLFTYPFLYKLGMEFLKERLGSENLNRFTLLDRDDVEAKIEDFKQEYDKMMKNALQDTRLDYDGVCFECSQKHTKRWLTG